ncbi:MAG TPA: CoA-binding protein, partial [Candidatus Limnocylindria bacterium]|nr:CoA-binding protein [Candidatus Limnocylindria bacterium]
KAVRAFAQQGYKVYPVNPNEPEVEGFKTYPTIEDVPERPGIISSFPVRSNGQKLEIVQGLPVNEFSRGKIDVTVKELTEERDMVREILK